MQQTTNEKQLLVADFMSSPVITIEPRSSLSDAIRVMAENNIGNLVSIAGDGSGVGLITEREIIQYLALNKTLPNREIKYVLSRKFVPITSSTTILDAAKIMISKGARLLVFTREPRSRVDELHGIITASDLMRAFLETDRNPSLDSVMSKRLVSLAPNNTILNAVKTMLKRRVGSVIVSGDGQRQGIFTERDLIGVLQRNVDVEDNIGRYSSFPIVTAKVGIGANEVGKLMFSHKIKRIPLMKNRKLVAIVTARDVVEAFQRRR